MQHASRGERKFPPSHVWNLRKRFLITLSSVLFVSLWPGNPASAAPPGAVIANQASLEYQDAVGAPVIVDSNLVELTTSVARTPATVTFHRALSSGDAAIVEPVGPSACERGGVFEVLPDPVLVGGDVVDPALPQRLFDAASFNTGEHIFLRLVDQDQNLDFQQVEYAVVTLSSSGGDSEVIRLTETAADSGIFTGYIPSGGGSATCRLDVASGARIDVAYTDPADNADTTSDTAAIDPAQRVFESRTGALIDGALIELVDATTGIAATVYGNDGVAQFPAAISSGATVTDSAGTVYVFQPGEFRFPVVPDGDYRLIVTPPPGYAAPSSVSVDALQALPGAPFALSDASFGAVFSKASEMTIAVDVPVDPRADTLFLQKSTTTSVVAPGDFVRYELSLENASGAGLADDVSIIDELPQGLRFVAGSVRIGGEQAADPEIAADGRVLRFDVEPLDAGQQRRIRYVAEVTGGKANDELVNRATASAAGGLISNEATATIRLTEDLFRNSGTIIGRVLEADCSQDTFAEEQGIAGVRVYLEDGRYAVTDDGGRFHFEGIRPGTHVAQIDTFSVPDWFDVIGCNEDPQFAGRADSRFVKLSRGSLKRADFFLKRKEPPQGRIDLELRH